MNKRYLLIIIVFVAVGIYLNRAYSYIYYKINLVGLKSPDTSQAYTINGGQKQGKVISYVALGDSLTAGVGVENYEQSYPYLLAQKMSSGTLSVSLNDLSVPGAKTADLKNNLISSAVKIDPDVITILIGVNDIHGNISLTEFKNNYEEILQRLTTETKAKINLINIPYIGADDLMLPPYGYYFNWQTIRYNTVINALAKTYDVKYLDLYSPSLAQFQKTGVHYSADSFHPSAQGYAAWAQIIYDHLN